MKTVSPSLSSARLTIENGYTGGRVCIMRASENPVSDAVLVATCHDSDFAELFAAAPSLLLFVQRLADGGHHAGAETSAAAREFLGGEVPASDRLASFGAWVLDLMQETEDWGGDMLSEIAYRAQWLRLARGTASGCFERVSAPAPSAEALPGVPLAPASLHPAADRILAFICEELLEGDRLPHQDWEMPDGNGTLGDALRAYNAACQAAEGAARAVEASGFPVLSIVMDSGGGAVSVDLCHSGAQLENRRASVGNLRLLEIPLSQVLKAPARFGGGPSVVSNQLHVESAIVWLLQNAVDGIYTAAEMSDKSTAEVLQMMDEHYPGGWSAWVSSKV